ncbi:Zn-ribbon domain-containing OB-fold protein [Haloarchaeobius sp. DFWS5]|uniref:Zn-ribbon domain-containing OB-fold protein n=1 Tax=Haloarchaeobius sp. DFWS5 TaxID=3446114 RepID=UPI003EBA0369
MTPSPKPLDGTLTEKDRQQALRDETILGQRCEDCGHETAAAMAACSRCRSRSLSVVELPQDGVVYTETTIAVPPPGHDGPYQVAVVSLGEEARCTARIRGPVVSIGDSVSLVDVMTADGRPVPVFERSPQ